MLDIGISRRQVLKSAGALAGVAGFGGLWVPQAAARPYLLPTPSSGLIQKGGDIDIDFIFPGLPPGGIATRCILGFMVNTTNANNLHVRAFLNSSAAHFFNYGPTDTNLTRFFQEVFSGPVFAPQTNKITFRVLPSSSSGAFNIHDMVLWFRHS